MPDERAIDLTPVQQQVIDLLAAGKTTAEAAEASGVSERTIYLWKNTEAFSRAWESVLATLWESTKASLKSAGGLAVKTLITIMTKEDSSDRDKLTASQTVLGNLHKVVTDDELRKRIEALIENLEGKSL